MCGEDGVGYNRVTVSSVPLKKPAEVAQSENKTVGISLTLGVGLTLNINPVRKVSQEASAAIVAHLAAWHPPS